MNTISKLFTSCIEIGIPAMLEYAFHTVKKKSGWLVNATPLNGIPLDFDPKHANLELPNSPSQEDLITLLMEQKTQVRRCADTVLQGNFHPFGGTIHPLRFEPGTTPCEHWSAAGDVYLGQDIKQWWEPARFVWAINLVRAGLVHQDAQYAQTFMRYIDQFTEMYAVNSAPQWTSAQEVAIRILEWTLVYRVFADEINASPDFKSRLIEAFWQHAARIPATLGYARSQNNNHLLSEALGLVIAGTLLRNVSRRAKGWLQTGIREFNRGILAQIHTNGTYSQHSSNYQRMMLQLALVYDFYLRYLGLQMPARVKQRLAAASRWVICQMEEESGRLPNLGHNDGSLILPMGCSDYRDYRPTAQAASLAFLGAPCLSAGPWDELALWFGLKPKKDVLTNISSPAIHQLRRGDCRVLLRGVQFHGRPAHADQLHTDIWWGKTNLAMDAGTFVYNDPPPWQNPFAGTLSHNTLTINDANQMIKAGKFLWLKQAQARWQANPSTSQLIAEHDGYKRRFGILHQRQVAFISDDRLSVLDQVRFIRKSNRVNLTLQWLLPDGKYLIDGDHFTLFIEERTAEIRVTAVSVHTPAHYAPVDVSIIRGSLALHGTLDNPILGWISNTYGSKEPALSLCFRYQTDEDLLVTTEWILKQENKDRRS